jgi:hypothetical protein
MTIRFADGTLITTTGNVTMFLFRNHPRYVEEWLNHKERFDYEMRRLDAFLRSGREVSDG